MVLHRAFFSLFILTGVFLLAGCGAVFVNEGSKNAMVADGISNPNKETKKAAVAAEQLVIANFEDGSKKGNPKLHNSDSAEWVTMTWAGNTVSSDFVVAGGANGTKMAAHVFGTLVDKGDFKYPEFDLQCTFKNKEMYDASDFSGIKFYWKCPSDDQGIKRRFAIAIAPTLPASDGGICEDNCYNHYGANLKPAADWVLMSYGFSDLTREAGWGGPVAPPDFTEHLKEFIYMKWVDAANNAAGTFNINYWVDEVEFF
jgi:hypothetical protein